MIFILNNININSKGIYEMMIKIYNFTKECFKLK